MTPHSLTAWRKALRWSQAEAAGRLGVSPRLYRYFEAGTRDGRPVMIPKHVRLACAALALGIDDYDGRPGSDIELRPPDVRP